MNLTIIMIIITVTKITIWKTVEKGLMI